MHDASAQELAKGLDIRLYNAYLKYYMHITNPDVLSDEDWAEELQNLHYIRTEERKASEVTT